MVQSSWQASLAAVALSTAATSLDDSMNRDCSAIAKCNAVMTVAALSPVDEEAMILPAVKITPVYNGQ